MRSRSPEENGMEMDGERDATHLDQNITRALIATSLGRTLSFSSPHHS